VEITKDNIVELFRSSGKTQYSFCKDNEIEIERLRYYLYKKPRREKTALIALKKEKVLPPSPAFISFNNINTPSLQKPQNTRHSVTIIQGQFTITEIASLLSQQDQI
jgi:hypothetical protein